MHFSAEMFRPLPREKKSTQEIVRPSTTYWQDAWRRLKKNPLAMAGLAFIIFLLLLATFGPMISPYSYSDQNLLNTFKGPSTKHWFGTDNLGRDVFTRVLYGARISLSIGIVASLVNFVIGVIYGGVAGYVGGKVDNVMMRIVDILYGIPFLLWVILLMVVIGPGLINIYIVLGVVYWLPMARIVRGQILSLKEQEYVLAAKTIGSSSRRILLRHLIPNTMGPIIVTMTLAIPEAIFTEAFLSFIGLGVSAPMASWGTLASEALSSLKSHPYLLFFPAAAICLTLFAFNFLGDGLRDALDPRMRK
ncbi:MAG: oligopeptide transport system permease protein [Clostridia bacterium]|jgi:oligopeptide transport system permease protein|nr:dppC 2 [Clostridiales bacterium]MDK2986420.1 oligopeptide transport system permease protein [Clostridia bacterium]